jgi:hypothetical protein
LEDPTRTIPNPERRALDKEIQAARADLARLEREYGAAAATNAEQRRPTMRHALQDGSSGRNRMSSSLARSARVRSLALDCRAEMSAFTENIGW